MSHASTQRAPRPGATVVAPANGRRFQAIVASSGSLDGVALRERTARELTPDEIEIAVKAASLNFRDVMFTMGMLPAAAFDSMLSAGALGVDCAGVISRVGSAVTDVAPGDEVIALSPASLASHAITKDLVARKPAGLSFADAAALPLAYVTAIYALERIARLERGERVLIHAATGGVGLAALAVAERAGAEIFATAGSEAKRAYLRARGIRHVMDSRTLDFAGQIMSATGGRGVDVVLNSLAGDAIRAGLSVLAPRGRFLEIGKADIYRRGDLPLDAFRNNISFAAIQIDVLSDSNRPLLRDLLREVTRGIEDGTLPPLPQQTVPVGSLAEGLRTLAQARHTGKVVIDLDDATVPIESSAEPRPLFRADATYLITGGRGGVGLALARWAVERGARRLVLMSRSATAADGDPAIVAMRQRGAEVLLANGDVTKPADVERTIAAADTPAAPLKGVFHAAMVMDDCGFPELDERRLATVLAPKLEGGWNLHRATRSRTLDHFVLFSSITSVYGNARQGSYAAANAFLDALAAIATARGCRRSRSISASSPASATSPSARSSPPSWSVRGRAGFRSSARSKRWSCCCSAAPCRRRCHAPTGARGPTGTPSPAGRRSSRWWCRRDRRPTRRGRASRATSSIGCWHAPSPSAAPRHYGICRDRWRRSLVPRRIASTRRCPLPRWAWIR